MRNTLHGVLLRGVIGAVEINKAEQGGKTPGMTGRAAVLNMGVREGGTEVTLGQRLEGAGHGDIWERAFHVEEGMQWPWRNSAS